MAAQYAHFLRKLRDVAWLIPALLVGFRGKMELPEKGTCLTFLGPNRFIFEFRFWTIHFCVAPLERVDLLVSESGR